jgi:hypothetical protein
MKVMAPVKRERQSRRAPLHGIGKEPRRRVLRIKPTHMGHKPGLNYDSVESLLEYGERERRR